MKKVINKSTDIELDKGKKAKYSDLLESCIKTQLPQWGFDLKDMRERNRLLDILEKKDKKEYSFEDNDFDNLKKIIELSRWLKIDKEILEFTNYILGIK